MFTALTGSQFYFVFADGVVSCGGPKKSLRTSSLVAGHIFHFVLWDQRVYSEKSENHYRFRFIF